MLFFIIFFPFHFKTFVFVFSRRRYFCLFRLKMYNQKLNRLSHGITPKIPQRCTVEKFENLLENNNRIASEQQMLADSVLK